ncbi:hypothetical protein [Dyadobacter helix]|uniref:hypothetical protein n=1 Tax=Dyadobacter helix TaxID=2822344 RepID=UPI001BFC6F45|nr:hypothetical protein [Dyadobacter sp. CECT 9275]
MAQFGVLWDAAYGKFRTVYEYDHEADTICIASFIPGGYGWSGVLRNPGCSYVAAYDEYHARKEIEQQKRV